MSTRDGRLVPNQFDPLGDGSLSPRPSEAAVLLRTVVETGSHLHMPAGRSTLTTTDAGSVTFECKQQVPGDLT